MTPQTAATNITAPPSAPNIARINFCNLPYHVGGFGTSYGPSGSALIDIFQ
jgi:hypothetical protein